MRAAGFDALALAVNATKGFDAAVWSTLSTAIMFGLQDDPAPGDDDTKFHINRSILQTFACTASAVLLWLDKTQYKTNSYLVSLLIPYCAFNLPKPIFDLLNTEPGHWICMILLFARLFSADYLPQDHAWARRAFPGRNDVDIDRQFRQIVAEMQTPFMILLLVLSCPKEIVAMKETVVAYLLSLMVGLFCLYQHYRHFGDHDKIFKDKKTTCTTIFLLIVAFAPVLLVVEYLGFL